MGDFGRTRGDIAKSICKDQDELRLVSAMYPMQPSGLLHALLETAISSGIRVTLYASDLTGHFDFIDDQWIADKAFKLVTIGGRVSRRVEAFADSIPCSLFEICRRIDDGTIEVDVFLALTSTADEDGIFSFGPSIAYSEVAARRATTIALELSTDVLSVSGCSGLHMNDVAFTTEIKSVPVPELRLPTITDTAASIGELIAGLIPNGATLQLGIGSIPEAFLHGLRDHKGLGIHSGAIPEGAIALIESGVITGANKVSHKDKQVTTSLLGTRTLYEYAHRVESGIEIQPVGVTHAPNMLASIPNLFAVNSALEVDLSGQVNAEVLDGRRVSSPGGQVDFMHAAHGSDGGASILAIPSTSDGHSRIVRRLSPPYRVTTHGNYVDYVVTEFGIADLRGKSGEERKTMLIDIAHPTTRIGLRDAILEGTGEGGKDNDE